MGRWISAFSIVSTTGYAFVSLAERSGWNFSLSRVVCPLILSRVKAILTPRCFIFSLAIIFHFTEVDKMGEGKASFFHLRRIFLPLKLASALQFEYPSLSIKTHFLPNGTLVLRFSLLESVNREFLLHVLCPICYGSHSSSNTIHSIVPRFSLPSEAFRWQI